MDKSDELEESDMKLLPGRETGMGGQRPRGGGLHAGRVYVDTHTLSTRFEYDPVVSKWPPDLYPSRFKGPVVSAGIEALTAHT